LKHQTAPHALVLGKFLSDADSVGKPYLVSSLSLASSLAKRQGFARRSTAITENSLFPLTLRWRETHIKEKF